MANNVENDLATGEIEFYSGIQLPAIGTGSFAPLSGPITLSWNWQSFEIPWPQIGPGFGYTASNAALTASLVVDSISFLGVDPVAGPVWQGSATMSVNRLGPPAKLPRHRVPRLAGALRTDA